MSISQRERPPVPAAAPWPVPASRRLDGEVWLAAIYRDHGAAVTAVARRVCGAQHAADVTQEVFLAVWQQPERFDPDRGSMRSFLAALAHNKAVDVVRSEHSRRARQERIDTSETPAQADTADRLLNHDTAAQVRAAVDALPTKEREAIVTTYYGGCTYRRAAAHLAEPEGTVKSRIRTGLQRLRPSLTDLDPDPGDPGAGNTGTPGLLEPPRRWFAPPSPAELDLLDLAVGPVLDIGCGPGRHVLALASCGVTAVGIDLSPHVVALARRRGAQVLQGSVFDAVPAVGHWGTCLLLDGNIGIGARPDALLARTRRLLKPGGRILVEAAAAGAPPRPRDVRFAADGMAGPAFTWADIGIDRLMRLAAAAGLTLKRRWHAEERWFAWLAT